MGFLQDWWNGEAKKGYTEASKRASAFEAMLESHQKHMEAERVFANMQPIKKKVPYAGLPFHPLYEQRNKMYEHRVYTRRSDDEKQ